MSTEAQPSELLADFRRTAFHFETRDRYNSDVGREALRRFLGPRSVAERAWKAGVFTERAGRAWLTRKDQNPFLASFVLFTAIGLAPPRCSRWTAPLPTDW